MSRRLVVPALVLVVAAACASGGSPDPVPVDRPVLQDAGTVLKTNEAPASASTFDAPATKVWTALQAAYKTLGIDVVVSDTRAHRMGNTSFYRTGRLNGIPLSEFADCGSGPTGPRANSSRVYFSVLSTVTAVDGTHTTVTTDVSPIAVDMSGTTSSRTTCGTTGELERKLYHVVQQQLGN